MATGLRDLNLNSFAFRVFYEQTEKLHLHPEAVAAFSIVLRDLVEILDSHRIPYFLSNGNALALGRGLEMMPWDDDIDIAMDEEYVDALETHVLARNQLVCDLHMGLPLMLITSISEGINSLGVGL